MSIEISFQKSINELQSEFWSIAYPSGLPGQTAYWAARHGVMMDSAYAEFYAKNHLAPPIELLGDDDLFYSLQLLRIVMVKMRALRLEFAELKAELKELGT